MDSWILELYQKAKMMYKYSFNHVNKLFKLTPYLQLCIALDRPDSPLSFKERGVGLPAAGRGVSFFESRMFIIIHIITLKTAFDTVSGKLCQFLQGMLRLLFNALFLCGVIRRRITSQPYLWEPETSHLPVSLIFREIFVEFHLEVVFRYSHRFYECKPVARHNRRQ